MSGMHNLKRIVIVLIGLAVIGALVGLFVVYRLVSALPH